jgi:hypothetical protein
LKLYGQGHTGSDTTLELGGFTFDGVDHYALRISKFATSNLSLNIHDNKFLGSYGAIWACRNSYTPRDLSGEAPVKIHDNLFYSQTGLCMSNSRSYDIYNNDFDLVTDAVKGSEAAYIGSGCVGSCLTRGDHYFHHNIFQGTAGDWAVLDFAFYSNPMGVTHLRNLVEYNTFIGNSNGTRYQMHEPTISQIDDVIRYNNFIGNSNG